MEHPSLAAIPQAKVPTQTKVAVKETVSNIDIQRILENIQTEQHLFIAAYGEIIKKLNANADAEAEVTALLRDKLSKL